MGYARRSMTMAMLLRRMGVDATVHGFRSSARSRMVDVGTPFELAESDWRTRSGIVLSKPINEDLCSNAEDR
jgi:hypothetical protein